MSSSRLHITFTGARWLLAASALATPAASRTHSPVGVARRPKPPPAICTTISTCSGFMPTTLATAPASTPGICDAVMTVHLSACRSTVHASGSICAWFR